MSNSRGEDAVGYGRPPKAHQFKKGQSGNPKGRPPGSRNTGTIVEETFNKLVTMRDDGHAKKIPAAEALVLVLLQGGLKGNPRLLKMCLDLMLKFRPAEADERSVDRELEDVEDEAILDQFLSRQTAPKEHEEEAGDDE